MESAEYKRMFDQEDRHWWFQGRLRAVSRILGRYARADGHPRLLDIGCGTGMFLERQGVAYRSFGLDFSREALDFSRQRGLTRLVCADSQAIPFASDSFDVVTAFDLIEHVPRDQTLVSEAHRILRPGGMLVASVPAHQFLWGAHDVALHHHRRYQWAQFDSLFEPAKWKPIRMTYMFGAIFPPAALIRSVRRLLPTRGEPSADTHRTADWLNRLLIGWHGIEAAWLERHDMPMGLSILTVREKLGTTQTNGAR